MKESTLLTMKEQGIEIRVHVRDGFVVVTAMRGNLAESRRILMMEYASFAEDNQGNIMSATANEVVERIIRRLNL